MTDAGRISKSESVLTIPVLGRLVMLLKDRLLLNAGYLMGVTLVSAVAGFVFWALAARLYAPEEVGLASALISIIQLLAGIASLGLGTGLIRFLPCSGNSKKMLNAVFSAVILAGLLVGITYLAGLDLWSPSLRTLVAGPSFSVAIIALLMVSVVTMMLQMTFLAYRKSKLAFLQALGINTLKILLVLPLASMGALGIIAAIAVAMMLGDVLGIIVLLPRVSDGYRFQLRLSGAVLKPLVPYSIGNYIADLLLRSPILLAAPLALETLGRDASAYMYVAWMIGAMLSSPGIALASSSFAEGAHAPRELRKILARAGLYSIGITVPISLAAFIGASWLLGIFGASYSSEATSLLRWLAAAAPIVALNAIYFSYLRVRRRMAEQIVVALVVVGVSLGFTSATISEIGLVSAGMGWLIAQIAVVIAAARHWPSSKVPMRAEARKEPVRSGQGEQKGTGKEGVVVAIPCYNEAAQVAGVVREAMHHTGRTVVVDDGSTDGTADVSAGAGAEVIRHPINIGPGAAARTCLQAGRESGTEVLVTLDGDGQHDPNEIPGVIAPVQRGEADLVIGSRFLGGYNNVPRYRKFGIDVITFLYNFGSQERITDGQSCFRAYSRKALEQIEITESGFGFSVETLVQARRAGLRIREVSISCIYDENSHSANPILHGVGVALMVVKHRLMIW